jgi:hypothetical protein
MLNAHRLHLDSYKIIFLSLVVKDLLKLRPIMTLVTI